MDKVYLQKLRDSTTDMMQCSIPDIFDFLRATYVILSPTQLKAKETDIDNIIYNPSWNVDTVFNKTQDFQDLCIMINNNKTDTQLVTYAYLFFQKAGILMDALKTWNTKIAADCTFTNLKTYMRKEYLDLQEVKNSKYTRKRS